MKRICRREFILSSAQAAGAVSLFGMAQEKTRVGLVQSTHKRLRKPVSPEDPLDYQLVRDMVWQAIDYGRPRAGSLEAKIKPGSWVLIKPNIVYLMNQRSWRSGDITDLRVTRAVLEYVASKTKAGRITIAEGGSYRSLTDPINDNIVTQNGVRRDATSYDWGTEEWPGVGGSYNDWLKEFSASYPGKKFDWVDLSYDVVLDPGGKPVKLPVPRLNGAGSFSNTNEYYVTNAIRNCDFLISVPVMKVHENCGVTACFKNYVGTAPRCMYGRPGMFWNGDLHSAHSVDTRIDPFIADLAAFHPPDFNVVDGIRGLQYTEHNNGRPDQVVRNNLVLAGEDPVAADAVVSRLLGFKPVDVDYLHMAEARGIGTYDFNRIDVVGDEMDRLVRPFAKPRTWYARANREWLVTGAPESDIKTWKKHSSFGDTLYFAKALGAPAPVAAAAATVRSEGERKGFLWMGLSGKMAVTLNGEKLLEQENTTRYRVGQVQKDIILKPGENRFVFRGETLGETPLQFAAVLVGPANNGDSLEGVRWTV